MRTSNSSHNVGGCRNPYVLAEMAAKKTIDWGSMSPLEVRNTLAATLHMPYEKLFSPQNDSPLYRKTPFLRRGRK